MIFKILITIGLVLSLAACKDDGSGSARTSGTTQVDKTSDKIYEDLMTKAESGIVMDTGNNSSVRVGDKSPYRTNTHNYQYKAMAMCLDWNVEAAQVKRKWFQVRTGNDWPDVGYGAVKYCEQQQLQRDLDCKCQLVDRDDTNVLQIPEDFRKSYESRMPAS